MSFGSHSSISAATSRALSATSPAERATAGPATAATRLAMVPMPYPTSWVSPPLTTTLSTGTERTSAQIWANVVSWPCP